MTSQNNGKMNTEKELDRNRGGNLSYTDDTENYFAQIQTPPGDETTIHSPDDFDLNNQKREEEFGAEAISANEVTNMHQREKETNMEENVEAGWGWAAIVLSLIALFNIWPLLMGIAGTVVGVMAKRRGADTLGNIAIVAGIAAIVIHLIIDAFV
ncbi:hypothetical protein [Salirhabdus sp. Marseille-P4669]|uniref:hypothetical protein n=1 Tax=Salirhabdus sp. Marseille-P4669 TaxID=2042310 RepID=UPI000C7D4AC2|nr:hypothetical protein [Salirhabdus sp. Marseille-P4669]